MKCDRVSSLLSAYLDRELNERGHATVQQHLGQCLYCRDEFERLAADRQLLISPNLPTAPAYLHSRVMAEIRSRTGAVALRQPVWARALGYAAAVAVIVGSAWAGVAVGSSFARLGRPNSVNTEVPGEEP
jgi:anti-sigma factor RsiW